MKIRIEISDTEAEEVIIKCRERTEKIAALEQAIENAVKGDNILVLYKDNTEYYIPKKEILFFETYDGKVYAHTKDRMYKTGHKLFELADIMPSYFVRISKSVIANVRQINSLRRELTGNGEITFSGCDKSTYFSRGYYNVLKDKLEEMRNQK